MDNSLTSDILRELNSDVGIKVPTAVANSSYAGACSDLWTNITTAPLTVPATNMYAADTSYWTNTSRETYEFKLVDGTKIIQDLNYNDIVELKEVELETPGGQTKRVVHLTLNNSRGGTKKLEIDCNLSMFMKIIGHKYKSWAKSLMEESVKNGLETN